MTESPQSIEALVGLLCREAQLLPTPLGAQIVFSIRDAKDAKLVFDLLVAYGVDAKLYNEPEFSKLYVTAPKSHALNDMFAQAATLKSLKSLLDQSYDSAGYALGFSTLPTQDKQLSIQFISNKPAAAVVSPPSHSVAFSDAKSPAMRQTNAKKAKEDSIFFGPEIMRQPGVRKNNSREFKPGSSLYQQVVYYIKGNGMIAISMMISALVLLLIFFSGFVMSKTFLCPDFATAEINKAWYCKKIQ